MKPSPVPAVKPRLTKTAPSPEEIVQLIQTYGPGYQTAYRSMVGGLLWIAISTRPDISFATVQVASMVSNPTTAACDAVTIIFRYLLGTRTYGLFYSREFDGKVVAFSDADWSGDLSTAKSTSGAVSCTAVRSAGALIFRSWLR